MGWLRRLGGTFAGSRLDAGLDEEMRFHIDERIEELVRGGMPREDARRRALQRFGNLTLAREQARDTDTLPWLGDLGQDARYALRTLGRSPGFAAAAVLTLALGIGATTAVFSVVYGVMLRPLPYPGADRLVRLVEEHPGGVVSTLARSKISNHTYFAWAKEPRTLDVLGGYATYEDTLRVNGDDVRLLGATVSPGLLGALATRPVAGRLFTANEGEPAATRVVLLSETLWRDRFRSSPDVVGRPLSIHGEPFTIVGVVPADFHFPDHRALFWTPYVPPRVSADPALRERVSVFSAIGRIAPGMTAAQVEAEGTAAARSVAVTPTTQLLFGRGGPPVVRARPLADDMTTEVKPALLVLAAAVACLLLISCANVANLFLSRGISRQRELAVRAAIGAGRGRLARQLLTESFLLSVGGGALGLALARALVFVMPLVAPAQFPRLNDVQIDARVLAFSLLASLATTALAGLAPALRGARFHLVESLRGGDGATADGFRGRRARQLRDGLLMAESAFATMLLVGAALLAHSFFRLTHVDAGYAPERVLSARVQMPRGATPERASQFADDVLARLRATPGVVFAGAANMMPFANVIGISTFSIPGPSGEPVATRSLSYLVTPGYAEALGLRLRAGRLFDARDEASGLRSMIVNDEFVRQYLGAGPAVGRRFDNMLRRTDNGLVTEIIGVVGTTLKEGNDRAPEPEIYFVHRGQGRRLEGALSIVVRTAGRPGEWAAAVRQTLRASDGEAIIERVEPLADPLWASVAQPRFATSVLGSFAGVALALASVGLYGVLSYSVSQRRRELGVRAALGASRAALVGLVLREGLTMTGAGAVIGLVAAAGAARVMQSSLFGITALDPLSFAAAPLVLLPIAVAACLIPAIRGASVSPATALRGE